MGGLWRFTRNPYARRLYDWLSARGLRFTWLTEYVTDLSTVDWDHDRSPAVGVRVELTDPDTVRAIDAPVDVLAPGEVVIAAVEDGQPRGYLFCSVDAPIYVHPLGRDISFDGAYIRRVFVSPDHRQRGIASTLLARACAWANDVGADRATTLVAPDNVPSRALFERHGFEPVRERRYLRIGPFTGRFTSGR